MVDGDSQVGDEDSCWAPGLISCFEGFNYVHLGTVSIPSFIILASTEEEGQYSLF